MPFIANRATDLMSINFTFMHLAFIDAFIQSVT